MTSRTTPRSSGFQRSATGHPGVTAAVCLVVRLDVSWTAPTASARSAMRVPPVVGVTELLSEGRLPVQRTTSTAASTIATSKPTPNATAFQVQE